MRYKKPEMELIFLKGDILSMSLTPGDVTEGGLPEIDMGDGEG